MGSQAPQKARGKACIHYALRNPHARFHKLVHLTSNLMHEWCPGKSLLELGCYTQSEAKLGLELLPAPFSSSLRRLALQPDTGMNREVKGLRMQVF